ncbi:hypothetical protein SDRG_10275 [Saprolegnia diclina VS20]|uniref:Sas10 C-terminal domain-containing protein n=1 Tax=Saprolegnia diclina (strain VS20) TaxID=1156394 RepID=T0RID2_SAPDV|nr:hypothetical protein SDRG_10275 [Saprolegnia diclina VS20]EQC32078.1 hypothetical protein SDRG_10275 [Saprolegnia diclina VS20]|eukprot:XP_008614480.1 hypothetical protein SDRG_10275 [Saprolegnia diclina VS20]
MGRRGRQSAKTGDGGAERRLAKKLEEQRKGKQMGAKPRKDDLVFLDDPSEDELEEANSESDDGMGDEEEVMQLHASSDDDDDDDDEEDVDGDEELLEERDEIESDGEDYTEEKERIAKMADQWGSSKNAFYSADTADYEGFSDQEEAARDEEEAALELQRKQAEMMDEDDFVVDANDAAEDDADEETRVGDELADIPLYGEEPVEKVTKDFSKMTKKQKLALVQETSPELLGLLEELKACMEVLSTSIEPAREKLTQWAETKSAPKYAAGLEYIQMKETLLLNYTMNISFYLQLKAAGKTVQDHPVLQHILQMRAKLNALEAVDEGLEGQLDELLTTEIPVDETTNDDDDDDDGLGDYFKGDAAPETTAPTTKESKKESKKASKKRKMDDDDEIDEDADAFYASVAATKTKHKNLKEAFFSHEPTYYPEAEDDEDDEDKKRGATYQMIKNRGLTAHKSKVNRNPRVKKRLQYEKALVRRKGQVRDVRVGEAARYGGELTGIKANITRSRKLRS